MTQHRRVAWLFACLGVAPFLNGFGCQDPDEPPADCDQRIGADAKGRWTIHGEGKRKNCKDPYLNGHMELDVDTFVVDGKPVATSSNTAGEDTEYDADAFVRRIQRAQYVLEAWSITPIGVEFAGEVNTCDVDFSLSERLPDGSFHTYEFHGFVESTGSIYGRFSGEGPSSCEVSGEFDVDVD
jgi:hypothetical protein